MGNGHEHQQHHLYCVHGFYVITLNLVHILNAFMLSPPESLQVSFTNKLLAKLRDPSMPDMVGTNWATQPHRQCNSYKQACAAFVTPT